MFQAILPNECEVVLQKRAVSLDWLAIDQGVALLTDSQDDYKSGA